MITDNQVETALIVVDAQNSFLHTDGGNYWDRAQDVIEPMQSVIAAARNGGALIVHVADRHRPAIVDREFDHLPRHCVVGEFDAQFYPGFGPDWTRPAREIIVEKRRYSAFFGTDLAMVLHELNIRRVVIIGVKTNVCVRATATDAFGHGFGVFVVGDAVGSNRENLHIGSLEDIDRYVGDVISVADASALVGADRRAFAP